MASTIDLLPTFAKITDEKLPKNKIDGVNILPLMYNVKGADPRDEFWYYYDYDLIAVRKNDWKLYFPCVQRSYEGMTPGKDGFPGPTWQKKIGFELYNLKDDVEERKDVLDQHPDIVAELKKIGDKARYELGDRLTGIKGKENREPGRIGESRVKFVNHLAVGKTLKLKYPTNTKYAGGKESLLVDGWSGSYDYNDGNWLGFEGTDFEAVVDLGEIKSIKNISVGFLENQLSWIFLPEQVEYFVSDDDKNFKKISSFSHDIKPNINLEVNSFEKTLTDIKCRYVKIYAKSIKVCPSWHQGKGGKAWVFVDEISVK